MGLFSKRENSNMKQLRELINGALTTANIELDAAFEIRNTAYHGHGSDRRSISEGVAAESAAEFKKAKLKLAAKLHEIAQNIETGKITL